MNMLEGGFDNKTDDNSVANTAPGDTDQYLISSFKPERLSWNSHEPNTRSEISSRRDSGERRQSSGKRQRSDKIRARQNPTNFVSNQLFSDVSGDKYSTFEDEEKFEFRSQDADIANHRQYDIRYSDEPPPEHGHPGISPVTRAPSKQANLGGGRSHGHNGQFYEGENIESGDYGHQHYSDPDRFVAERQSRYQNRARADYTRDEGGHHYQDHHPVSRPSYPPGVTRRQDPGAGYYDTGLLYEDSQPAFNDHVVTRQIGADRQLAPVGWVVSANIGKLKSHDVLAAKVSNCHWHYFSEQNWTQTFVNGSAVALLAFLFLLNLTQV